MLLSVEYPDPLVSSVLRDSYPRLVAHCLTIIQAAEASYVPPKVETGWASSLRHIIPWPRAPAKRRLSTALAKTPEAQKEEWRYRLWRWGFFGASVLAAATYLHFAQIVIVLQPQRAVETAESRVTDTDEEDDLVDTPDETEA